jgi:hypothetical protein
MNLHHLIRQPSSRRTIGDKAKGMAARLLCGVFLVSASSAISSCASKDGIRVPDGAATVSNDQAFALPPPGGPAIVNVIQHHFNNAVRQDIFLFTSASTSGQNVLRISFFGPVGLDYDDQKSMSYTAIRDSSIASEMRHEFPGVVMSRSPYYVQNNYGPFGYATGRSRTGDTCLYAWQQIRSNANSQSAFQNRGTIQVRLRLCDAHSTEQQLLGVMYRYTITGTFPAEGWNPYDAPPKVDASLGGTESPIYPGMPSSNAGRLPPALQPQTAPVIYRQATAVSTPSAARQQPVAASSPTGPIVPPPTTAAQGAKPASVVVPGPGCATTTAEGTACK